jgi:signal transduction histidine kinase
VRVRLTALYGALILVSGAGLLAITNALVRHATDRVLPPGLLGSAIAITKTSGVLSSAAAPGGGPVGGAVAGTATAVSAEHAELIHQLFVQSAVAMSVMVAVSVLLGWLMAGRFLRPLHTMTATVREISAADLKRRLALDGPADELTALAGTFDDLLGRLEASFDAQRRFVGNASHELRTPLTMIRTSLDVAEGKPQPPREIKALAVKIRRGLDRADQLLDGFLALSRAEHAPIAGGALVDLDWVAVGVLTERSEGIAGKRLAVDTDLAAAAVRGDEVLLAQLAGNLIDNAIRHNHQDGSVRVTTRTDGQHACLTVDSSGPVLDDAEVRALTEPFRRAGPARTGPGHGLGLSIVAAVTAAHGGTLDLSARAGGGLSVTVTLPAATVPPDPLPADPLPADPLPARPVPAGAQAVDARPPA